MELHLSLLEVHPLTRQEWLKRYKRSIRVSCEPEMITGDIALVTLGPRDLIFLPWYNDTRGFAETDEKNKRNWRDSESAKLVELSDFSGHTSWNLIRIPGVMVDHVYDHPVILALDGCHRLTETRVSVAIVDCLQPSSDEVRYITDLFAPFWKNGKYAPIMKKHYAP